MQKIVEILEWAMDDYYSNNPDPLDQRQPHKIMPNCIYGYILRYMLKFSDFLDKCLVSYIMPHHNNLELNILAARVMVMSLPVIDSSIFPGDADVQKELFKYALESESREMRAYATVLLNPSITPETAHIFRSEIVKLIIQSLTNLKRLYGQMVESGSETASNEGVPAEGIARATDFSELVRSEAKAKEEERARAVEDGKSLDVALGKEAEDKECENRAKILENGRENGTAQINGTSSAEPTVENIKPPRPPGSKRTADEAKLTTEANSAKKIKVSRRDRRPINKIPGAMTPLADCGDDELSRSSTVDDMKMVFIGNNKIYPLTIEMEQRMILGFLQCAFEFTDHVSVLTEHSALDVILKYLNVNEYHDIRLLFEALFSLSSMLIHLRLAWDFVNRGGLLRLIGVNRNSVAAAAVCVCLHHISQFDEIMEHVCQAPGKAVDNIVSYAIWQLSHGYESCGGRICVFFQYGLYYKNILDRFDHRDGLRVLFNYGNSKLHDFLYGDFQDNDVIDKVQEKMGEYCQVLRNINVCLTQYILSHILLKYEHIKKNHADKLPAHLKKAVATGKIPYKDLCKKQLKMDPETESKALEVLRHFIPSSGGTFHPISHLRHLGFVTLYIRALALRTEFYLQMPSLKSDVVLGILKIFHYATVSPAVIKDLTDSISFQHGVRCGIR
uniref:LisH domain-containing protein n=2 Tax=Bursaphelenchus xylophilus TaxID=6326 RepID=A0A1I7SES5_BURXY